MKLSLKSQIILTILSVSLISVLIVSTLALVQGKTAIETRVYEQLTSLQNAKADRIKSYFTALQRQAIATSQISQIVDGLSSFSLAYKELQEPPTQEAQDKINDFYKAFTHRLQTNLSSETFVPKRFAEINLQYLYLIQHKQLNLYKYQYVYEKEQPTMRAIAQAVECTNLYLINSEGDLVYALIPEIDLGTNLVKGVYKDSAFSKALLSLKLSHAHSTTAIADFEAYIPNNNQPSAFIIAPVFKNGISLGFIAYRISLKRIDSIMTYSQKWREYGLGRTLETYLVGSDYLMRSSSRAFLEKPEAYVAGQRRLSNQAALEKMLRQKTTVLLQEIHTDAVEEALKGNTGIRYNWGYQKHYVLSSYKSIDFPGLPWVLIAEISADEAYKSSSDFMTTIITSSALLGVFEIIIANWIANLFQREYIRDNTQNVLGSHLFNVGATDSNNRGS